MPAAGETGTGIGVDGDSFTVLTANVGTGAPRCLPYYMKPCRKGVEARIARRIQQLRPEVGPRHSGDPAALAVCTLACGLPGQYLNGPDRRSSDPQAPGTRLYHRP
jgi:hypothetical protein